MYITIFSNVRMLYNVYNVYHKIFEESNVLRAKLEAQFQNDTRNLYIVDGFIFL